MRNSKHTHTHSVSVTATDGFAVVSVSDVTLKLLMSVEEETLNVGVDVNVCGCPLSGHRGRQSNTFFFLTCVFHEFVEILSNSQVSSFLCGCFGVVDSCLKEEIHNVSS